MQGGMISVTLAASESVTLELPKGATSFYVNSAALMVQVNSGNTTNGAAFLIVTKQGNFTIENFMGGYYTFTEPTGGAGLTLVIWSQGMEESQ